MWGLAPNGQPIYMYNGQVLLLLLLMIMLLLLLLLMMMIIMYRTFNHSIS
jgi:hypothetical protein